MLVNFCSDSPCGGAGAANPATALLIHNQTTTKPIPKRFISILPSSCDLAAAKIAHVKTQLLLLWRETNLAQDVQTVPPTRPQQTITL
jgi:hypothetical protein